MLQVAIWHTLLDIVIDYVNLLAINEWATVLTFVHAVSIWNCKIVSITTIITFNMIIFCFSIIYIIIPTLSTAFFWCNFNYMRLFRFALSSTFEYTIVNNVVAVIGVYTSILLRISIFYVIFKVSRTLIDTYLLLFSINFCEVVIFLISINRAAFISTYFVRYKFSTLIQACMCFIIQILFIILAFSFITNILNCFNITSYNVMAICIFWAS